MRRLKSFSIGSLILTLLASPAAAQVRPSSSSRYCRDGAYVYIYRTPAHVSRSSPLVFHQVSTAISEYLAEQHIPVRRIEESDPRASSLPGENRIISVNSMHDVLEKARLTGAVHALVVSVDRPFTSWIKVKMQCIDLSGTVLWQEAASNATGMSGSSALKSVLKQLRQRLEVRMGPSVQLNTEISRPGEANTIAASSNSSQMELGKKNNSTESAPTETPPSGDINVLQQSDVGRESTVVLPAGTVVRLILTAPVDAKTAKVGDKIDCRVLNDVKAGELVVISRKAAASGIVTNVEEPRRKQHPGSITIKIETVSLVTDQVANLHGQWTVQAGNRNVSLETQADANDLVEQTGGVGVLFLPLLLLKHGEHVVLPAGMELEAKLDKTVAMERTALVQAQPAPAAKRHVNPSVIVYHLSNPQTDRPKFYCGKSEVARLQHGTTFQFSIPPGKYWFRSQSKGNAIPLTLEEGGEYYVRVDSVMTWGNPSNPGYSQFVRVRNQDVAEIETASASPLDPKYIKDISKIDLALLQAAP